MEFGKIYKRDVSGNIRVWWAETDDKAYWRTHAGTLHGEIVTSEWRYAPGKRNKTDKEQAFFEANAAMEKKLGVDYRLFINDVDIERNSIIKPMLAHTYIGWEGQCYAQPKLDGMRCLATSTGLWSRNNKQIVSSPHIEKQLKEFFSLHPNIILDGELYNHVFHDNFNMIMSLARKTKLSLKDFDLSREYLQYHVYDLYDQDRPNNHYLSRHKMLDKFDRDYFDQYIYLVRTETINSKEELDFDFAELLKEGYEGQIIRYDKPYEQKRSIYLLKRKDFIDEEFILIDIEEGVGNWEGYAKRAICVTSAGKQFGAGIAGTQEFCSHLLDNKKNYKSVTIKYHELTPDGVPRFPIAEKFYDKEFSELEERIKPKKDLFR